MYGIKFRDGTSNSLICFVADFAVRTRTSPREKVYRVTAGPTNMAIYERQSNGEFLATNRNAKEADIEAILPPQGDFGYRWLFADFVTAMTWWAEGFQRGHSQGRVDAFDEMRD